MMHPSCNSVVCFKTDSFAVIHRAQLCVGSSMEPFLKLTVSAIGENIHYAPYGRRAVK